MTATVRARSGDVSGWRAVPLAPGLLLIGLLLAAACRDSDSPVAPGALRNCAEVAVALELELAAIQSCSQASECGQVLEGTSCGCTRNLVARRGANTTAFYAIVVRGQAMQCPATEFATVCDCPSADGFACVAGRCAWNYL